MPNLKSKTKKKDDMKIAFFLFLLYQSPCSNGACVENSICQAGYTNEGYRCICPTGFTGLSCSQGNWSIAFLVAFVSCLMSFLTVSTFSFSDIARRSGHNET